MQKLGSGQITTEEYDAAFTERAGAFAFNMAFMAVAAGAGRGRASVIGEGAAEAAARRSPLRGTLGRIGERIGEFKGRVGEYARRLGDDLKGAWDKSGRVPERVLEPAYAGGQRGGLGGLGGGGFDMGRPGRFFKNYMESRATRAASSGDFTPGRTPLKEFDIDRYGSFNSRTRKGDSLEGHELLQNAWLREHGHSTRRGTGSFSRDNPAVALSEDLHTRVGVEQRRLGLFDAENLRTMDADTNIRLNAEALRRAEVPEHVIQTLVEEATRHANSLP